ncbi:hypothetical protein AB0F13_24530 [Streptomyces sp. NPDC026206]|uniref:hypothetical protein n=1 Tax=Streptomyces sp. NPDC026206 TaxID=3157089 RepID=UPI0033F99F67
MASVYSHSRRQSRHQDAADLHLIELAKADIDGTTVSHEEAMAVYEQSQVS